MKELLPALPNLEKLTSAAEAVDQLQKYTLTRSMRVVLWRAKVETDLFYGKHECAIASLAATALPAELLLKIAPHSFCVSAATAIAEEYTLRVLSSIKPAECAVKLSKSNSRSNVHGFAKAFLDSTAETLCQHLKQDMRKVCLLADFEKAELKELRDCVAWLEADVDEAGFPDAYVPLTLSPNVLYLCIQIYISLAFIIMNARVVPLM